MLHRVFIAVNLPEEIKEKLFSFGKKYQSLPAKWVEKENIHITVLFLGNLDDNQLFETIQNTKQILKNHKPFLVEIEQLTYGPDNKIPPKMIWAKVKKNKEFSCLKNDIENALFDLPEYKYKTKEGKSFSPHITIARIESFKFRALPNNPEIDIPLNMQFEINSIDIMESVLTKKGPEYTILESINL
ncbi:RNA 2',3'-cyclic phosphodiesterase [Patescibacteria group bacterium]|nr:RNA 2',3'-cyclic phosphodiesterase [Patescibacteria group bacterium]MBU4078073.1 RNA 2',3'-cyclic phosphodiesterase [Patescibacteria group bacterium]